ncbi:MAG: type VI secretion system Vgr family protein [Niabella sp.]
MADNSILCKTEIVIQDYLDNKPVVFSNFNLQEALINVNSFSFSIRPEDKNTSFTAILDFKKQVLGKEVKVSFKDTNDNVNHEFTGIVMEVSSAMVDNYYYEFYIVGKGVFCKISEIAECHSFYKKKLDDIIGKTFDATSLSNKVEKKLQTTKALHYIVQYNQTSFDFVSSMAVRYGEWMYYDGQKLQLGKKPEGEAIELKSPGDISNINIRAHAIKTPEAIVATDIFKSEPVNSETKAGIPENDFIKATEKAGSKFLENPGKKIFVPSGFSKAESDDKYDLEQKAIYASSIFLTGLTRNNKLAIGKRIKIKDANDSAGQTYIITQISHNVSNSSTYSNSFTAVPVEVDVPPYTNPLQTPKAFAQAAIITDNEDDAGLGRVQVKFPWMADDEKTPWVSVLTPHAGNNKGFRFLPEKDDEVLVDFWDGNAELPYIAGSLYTDKNKSGITEKGNNKKLIGSRTARRLEIDDDEESIILGDTPFGKKEAGGLLSILGGDEKQIKLSYVKSDSDASEFIAKEDGETSVVMKKGGAPKCIVKFDPNDNSITIESDGDIKLKSKGNITIDAMKDITIKGMNVNVQAKTALKMEGTSSAELKGLQTKVEGTTQLEAKGAMAKVEGSGMLEVKSGGIAKIQGSLVTIN